MTCVEQRQHLMIYKTLLKAVDEQIMSPFYFIEINISRYNHHDCNTLQILQLMSRHTFLRHDDYFAKLIVKLIFLPACSKTPLSSFAS